MVVFIPSDSMKNHHFPSSFFSGLPINYHSVYALNLLDLPIHRNSQLPCFSSRHHPEVRLVVGSCFAVARGILPIAELRQALDAKSVVDLSEFVAPAAGAGGLPVKTHLGRTNIAGFYGISRFLWDF